MTWQLIVTAIYFTGFGFSLASNLVNSVGFWGGLVNMLFWPVIIPGMIAWELWEYRNEPKPRPYNPADYE